MSRGESKVGLLRLFLSLLLSPDRRQEQPNSHLKSESFIRVDGRECAPPIWGQVQVKPWSTGKQLPPGFT